MAGVAAGMAAGSLSFTDRISDRPATLSFLKHNNDRSFLQVFATARHFGWIAGGETAVVAAGNLSFMNRISNWPAALSS